jgi:uncharacterized membrane-anchored protein YitT (DUF2179 family)
MSPEAFFFNRHMKRDYLWREIKSYLIITAGLALGAIGWTGFIIPSEIVGGGLTGVSSILFFLFDIDVGMSSLIINVGLLFLAMKTIGASFGIKSIYSVVVFAGFLSFFSRKHKELAEQIVYTGKKGLTIIPATGGYTGEEIKVLMVFARKKESSILFGIIKSVDPEAFITMGNVMGIFGEGYDKLKIREKRKKPLSEIEANL